MNPSLRVTTTSGIAAVEGGDGVRDQRCVGGGEGGYPQAAGGELVEIGELLAGRVKSVQYCLGMGEEASAGLRELYSAWQAVEQRGTGFVFQGGDLAGDGGLGVAEDRGRCGE